MAWIFPTTLVEAVGPFDCPVYSVAKTKLVLKLLYAIKPTTKTKKEKEKREMKRKEKKTHPKVFH